MNNRSGRSPVFSVGNRTCEHQHRLLSSWDCSAVMHFYYELRSQKGEKELNPQYVKQKKLLNSKSNGTDNLIAPLLEKFKAPYKH